MAKRLFVLISCLAFITHGLSQDKEPLPRFSIRGTVSIPKIIGSQAYRISFLGVYDAGLTFNFRLVNNLSVGIGYKNTMANATSEFRNKGANTQQQIHDGVLRFGFDKMTGPKSFITLSLSSGYGLSQYIAVKAAKDSLNGKYPTDFTAGFIRPEFNANFLIEDNFAFGVHIAYNMMLARYDPRLNCFDTYTTFSSYSNRSNMGWISFGFGFYFAPKKKKG